MVHGIYKRKDIPGTRSETMASFLKIPNYWKKHIFKKVMRHTKCVKMFSIKHIAVSEQEVNLLPINKESKSGLQELFSSLHYIIRPFPLWKWGTEKK
jgi:hypothetical protein